MAIAAMPQRPGTGLPSAAPQPDFQSLVLSCNKDGMDSLRKGQLKAAFEQFKYAEAILIANQAEGDCTSLLAVTCNNLGCYYKKTGKLHGALSYLRRALKMEIDLATDEVTLAGTHLNICAILSKLEKHEKAVEHATCALELINKRVGNAPPDQVSQDDYSVLAIAYHNVAVERGFLNEYEKAATAFRQGYQVAKRCLGEDHPLCVTLGKNCDDVLQKSQKIANLPSTTAMVSSRALMKDAEPQGQKEESTLTLPSIGRSKAADPSAALKDTFATSPTGNIREEAANWVQNEAAAWSTFATTTLSGDAVVPAPPTTRPMPTPSTLAGSTLRDAQVHDLQSSFREEAFKGIPFTATALRTPFLKKTPLGKAIEASPEALLDIIESDNGNHAVAGTRSAPNDYRPNRMIKGATRTARVVRRTGLSHSTKHRDQVMSGRMQGTTASQKTAYQRRIAAEKIQRVWRSWYKYCQENHDWMTTTWIAATMIQANWRSYHVRRQKLDRAACCIQRHVRGHLVRKVLTKHRAAVTIQRHIVGFLTRSQLRRLQIAATKIESLARGAAARRRVRKRRALLNHTALTIQCAFRQFLARRLVGEKRAIRNRSLAMQKAATDIQRLFRGFKGRRRAAAARDNYLQALKEYQAATKLQAMARRDAATKRVDRIRAEELEKMHIAATLIRKIYIGHRSRRRYKMLMKEFGEHEHHVRTMQRYARGFLVRLRMWREAIRAEEELWGAMEIQRTWRGYKGRVKWENKYEHMWRREMAAAMIQRNIRGWCARVRVGRTRRRLARAEFERARRRFRSAQRIQALGRGMLSRKVTRARNQRKLNAIIHIQRIWRGHELRQRLWMQVLELRATMIQAAMRGFLTRNRRFHLIAVTICIQRGWRQWRRKPREVRQRAREELIKRKENAKIIQAQFRKHQENKTIDQIHQQDASVSAAPAP